MAVQRRAAPPPKRTPPDLPDSPGDLDRVSPDALPEPLRLEDAWLERATLSGVTLPKLSAVTCVLSETSFAGSAAGSTYLRDVRLVRCDLSNAVLRGCEARRVEFIDCRLTGLKLFECRWQDVLLENCDARYAQFNDGSVIQCEFRSTRLSEADFRNANLKGTVFSGCSLDRADFSGAQLATADLRGSSIEEIQVFAENVRGAIVTPAQAIELARLLGLVVR